jgi:hypothetical protein
MKEQNKRTSMWTHKPTRPGFWWHIDGVLARVVRVNPSLTHFFECGQSEPSKIVVKNARTWCPILLPMPECEGEIAEALRRAYGPKKPKPLFGSSADLSKGGELLPASLYDEAWSKE